MRVWEKPTGNYRLRWQKKGFFGRSGYLVLQAEVHGVQDVGSCYDPGTTMPYQHWKDAGPEHLIPSLLMDNLLQNSRSKTLDPDLLDRVA